MCAYSLSGGTLSKMVMENLLINVKARGQLVSVSSLKPNHLAYRQPKDALPFRISDATLTNSPRMGTEGKRNVQVFHWE